MSRTQSITLALLGAVLLFIGFDGEGYLAQAMLVASGVFICAAFTIKE